MKRSWMFTLLFVVACSVVGIAPADAQASGVAAFITTQGNDTISLERYTRAGNTITGIWVSHQSGTQSHDYVLTLGADGLPVRYEMRITVPGKSLPGSFKSVSIVYGSDAATYVTVTDTLVTQRVPMSGAYPWLGRSVVALELALARLRSARADSAIVVVNSPTGTDLSSRSIPVKFFGRDSVRIAGVAWARLDQDGRLLALRSGPAETRRVDAFDVAAVVAGFVVGDAPRAAAAAAAVAARVEIKLSAAELQRFVGEYSLNPTTVMTITRDGDTLHAGIGGQPMLQLFAESPTKFFLKAVDAEVEFEVDGGGNVTGLVVVQHGARQRAMRKP